jgi:hypothetical protein
MAKLPFKTSPKQETREVGNEDIGILEFPVVGDLTVREQAFITEHLAGNSTFLEVARIANKVAKAAKIQPVAAHRFVTKCVTFAMLGNGEFDEREENLRIKFARELEELSAFLLKTQWERQLVTVTALIRFRLEGMEEFTIEEARDMSQQLLTEIYAFSLIETGAASDDEGVLESEEEIAENLGK